MADYCAEGSAAPLPCPGGTTMDASLDVMTSANDCLECGVGTFCPVGSANATLCAPGTVNPLVRQESCVPCTGGSYQDAEGQTACTACVAGSYCPVGAAAALPCAGGTYSSAIDNSAQSDCTAADAGYFAVTGSVQQMACAKGTFTNATMAVKDSCMVCSAGTYQDLEGNTTCKPCPGGCASASM